MKRLLIFTTVNLLLLAVLAIPHTPSGTPVSAVIPTAECAPTAEQCNKWANDCAGVTNNAEAMCLAIPGSSYFKCHITEWMTAYSTCIEGVGCYATTAPPRN